jgi:hypothetical protein
MAKTTGDALGFQVDAEDLLKLQTAFKLAGKDAMKAARTVTNEVGKAMAGELKGAGMVGQGPLAALVARKGIKVERRQVFKGKDGQVRVSKFTGGYIPTVAIGKGGELPVSRKATPGNPKPTAEQVWAGTEFGALRPFPNGGKRFRKRIKAGYWFFPTWNSIKDHYADVWQQRMADLVSTFERS